MNSRLPKLRQLLTEKEMEAIIISQADNRRYLSGFVGTAGFLLITQEQAVLATDFRYTEQAKTQAPDFEVVQIEGEPQRWFPRLAARLERRRWAFEAHDLTVSTHGHIAEAVKETSLQLIPTQGLVEGIRAVKDEEELACLKKAAALSDAAFQYIAERLRPGMTELGVAWEVEKYFREHGSEPLPYDVIVASGPNSALPHAHPTDRPIQEGEPIIFDIGARCQGYCSDLSRTLCLGQPDDRFPRLYDLVLGAQLTALATIKPGLSGEQADGLARTVIEQGGYGEAFGHGLGHGVGLVVHELPRLGKGSTDLLAEGMVFTVEPGVYISGWGGIRIEDMAILEKGKARSLSQASKTPGSAA
ncbi:MAG: Xaa-Pro peptidase family protein [Chloroflexota bacterium]|nr:Xaa-Pro peptidase family protein [Chloroflexota bacterium]